MFINRYFLFVLSDESFEALCSKNVAVGDGAMYAVCVYLLCSPEHSH